MRPHPPATPQGGHTPPASPNKRWPQISNAGTHESIAIRTDSLETRAEPAALRTHAENQAIPEPILLYQASKCKQTKEQDSEDSLWVMSSFRHKYKYEIWVVLNMVLSCYRKL